MRATTHTRHMGDHHTDLLQGARVLAPKEAMAVHSTRQVMNTNEELILQTLGVGEGFSGLFVSMYICLL
jgi:hypothetical protein